MSSSQEDAGHVTALSAPVSASSLQPPAATVSPPETAATEMPPWAIPFDTPARNRFLKDYRIQAASATSTILACLAVVSLPCLVVGRRLKSMNSWLTRILDPTGECEDSTPVVSTCFFLYIRLYQWIYTDVAVLDTTSRGQLTAFGTCSNMKDHAVLWLVRWLFSRSRKKKKTV